MPQARKRAPRLPKPDPEERKAAKAMLWRFDRIRTWKDAVHAEAWRQAQADGTHRCGPSQFEDAGTRLEASGMQRPPEDWFEELQETLQWLAQQPRAPDAA